MYDIETTEEFDKWIMSVRDGITQKVILKRIRTMSLGTLGDVHSLSDGLFEARIHHGPGYRIYFVNQGSRIIILLCGGNKTTQKRDILRARELVRELNNA